MQGLALDTLIADAVPALLPSLRQLRIASCHLTAAVATSLVSVACSRLQHVEVDELTGQDTREVGLQLMQLAGLPSLASISLLDNSCPTQFLGHLSTRLTALHLDASYDQVEAGTLTPMAAWQATLMHVARCTALHSLTIPCATEEELGAVAPALQQLRHLHLNGPGARADGDAMVERLMALPHLTSLTWDCGHMHVFRRSHASSPCRWRELSFESISPHQLARLPLQSLASPVSWRHLVMDRRTSLAEVQAARDNVAQRCPAIGAWWAVWPWLQFLAPGGGGSGTFTRGAGNGDTPAALLRAVRPLLAARWRDALLVSGLAWDAELVKALGEVVPRTCVRLRLNCGSISVAAAVQLAMSLPWLQELELAQMVVRPPQAVTAYVGAATSIPGRRCLREVEVSYPVRPEGMDVEARRAAWEEVQETVRSLGVACTLYV